MHIKRVDRYHITEKDGVVSVPVVDAAGRWHILTFDLSAAGDMQGGLVRFHETYGAEYRHDKAAKAKKLIADGVARAAVIARCGIVSENWLDCALRGVYDLPGTTTEHETS